MKQEQKTKKPKAVNKPKSEKAMSLKGGKSLRALSKAIRHENEGIRKDAASQLEALLNRPWTEINLAAKKIAQTTYPVVNDCGVFCAIVKVYDQGALLFVLKDYKNIGDSVACCYSGIAKPDKAVSNGRVMCANCGADFSKVKSAADSKELYYSPIGTAIHCIKCNSTEGLYVVNKKLEKAESS